MVVTDTFGRPWREGLAEVALGCAGIDPLLDLRGRADLAGRALHHTVVALADEVAAAAGLVMGRRTAGSRRRSCAACGSRPARAGRRRASSGDPSSACFG